MLFSLLFHSTSWPSFCSITFPSYPILLSFFATCLPSFSTSYFKVSSSWSFFKSSLLSTALVAPYSRICTFSVISSFFYCSILFSSSNNSNFCWACIIIFSNSSHFWVMFYSSSLFLINRGCCKMSFSVISAFTISF